MRRATALLFSLGLLAPAAMAQNMYVYGDFCSTCMTASAAHQLYDDGLHGDGAAGDGVWGVDIVSDQPAGQHGWWVTGDYPYLGGWPYCPIQQGQASPARLWTGGPGETIHFRVGGSPPGAGWDGSYVASDHSMPPGTLFDVTFMWDGPGYCDAYSHYPAQRSGTTWSRVVTLQSPATYYWYFRSPNTTLWFWIAYNAGCGGYNCLEYPFLRVTTTQPNTDVLFELDEMTGKLRATVLGPTPTRALTWGMIKTIYR